MLIVLSAIAGSPDELQAQGPTARKGSKGPSLETTLHFIRDKLLAMGAVNYIEKKSFATGEKDTQQVTVQFMDVTPNSADCVINYKVKYLFHSLGTVSPGPQVVQSVLHLNKVEKIVVITQNKLAEETNAKAGWPGEISEIDPPIFAVDAGDGWAFPFYDQDMANRVARAISHAVELCGGGSKDPF